MATTNTSVLVFIMHKDGRIFLISNDDTKKLSGYKLDLTYTVDIRKKACEELYLSHDILIYPRNLKHQGILINEGRNVFIYTADEFETDKDIPTIDPSWYPRPEIPFDKLHDFDRYVLTMILDGEKIGM